MSDFTGSVHLSGYFFLCKEKIDFAVRLWYNQCIIYNYFFVKINLD